jgi:hypothetical protein
LKKEKKISDDAVGESDVKMIIRSRRKTIGAHDGIGRKGKEGT